MKHAVRILIIVLLVIFGQFFSRSTFAETLLKVGVYNFEPLVFYTEKGDARGLFIDVLNEIAEQEEWTIEYVPGSWHECLRRLEQGEIDLLGSIAYSEQRAATLDFTNEFLFLDWGLVYRQQGSSLETVFDLEGKTISALKGSIYTQGFRSLLEQFGIRCTLLEMDEYTEVFQAVHEKKADAGINANVYGILLERNYAIERTTIVFSPVKIRFAAPKNAQHELLRTLDTHFGALKADKHSEYYRLYDKWMGFYQAQPGFPRWLFWLLVFLLGASGLLGVFSLLLRQQVRKRTEELRNTNQELNRHKHVLQQAHDDLQERLKELKQMQVEREHLNEQLLGKNTELEQIVYVTSHDLRSPLVNIQGFSKELELACQNVLSYLQEIALPESIRIQVNALLKEEIPESVNFILTSASKMDLLLKGLLRISRLGRAALGPELLDMNALMSDIAADSEFKRKEKGISLRVDDLPACYADRGQVLQVFSNLLENAIKYLDSDRPGMIHIYGDEKDGQRIYCVEDNGIGIAPAHHAKIFEIFQQLAKDAEHGEGLGLTIVKRILERLHGDVWVESEHGKGSKFFVMLPATGDGNDDE